VVFTPLTPLGIFSTFPRCIELTASLFFWTPPPFPGQPLFLGPCPTIPHFLSASGDEGFPPCVCTPSFFLLYYFFIGGVVAFLTGTVPPPPPPSFCFGGSVPNLEPFLFPSSYLSFFFLPPPVCCPGSRPVFNVELQSPAIPFSTWNSATPFFLPNSFPPVQLREGRCPPFFFNHFPFWFCPPPPSPFLVTHKFRNRLGVC